MTYTATEITASLTGRRDRLNGGSLQLMAADGTTVIATVPLDNPCGTVSGALLTFAGMPKTVTPAVFGAAIASARLRTSGGVDLKTGITVSTSGAQINLSKLTPTAGDTLTNSSATLNET